MITAAVRLGPSPRPPRRGRPAPGGRPTASADRRRARCHPAGSTRRPRRTPCPCPGRRASTRACTLASVAVTSALTRRGVAERSRDPAHEVDRPGRPRGRRAVGRGGPRRRSSRRRSRRTARRRRAPVATSSTRAAVRKPIPAPGSRPLVRGQRRGVRGRVGVVVVARHLGVDDPAPRRRGRRRARWWPGRATGDVEAPHEDGTGAVAAWLAPLEPRLVRGVDDH